MAGSIRGGGVRRDGGQPLKMAGFKIVVVMG